MQRAECCLNTQKTIDILISLWYPVFVGVSVDTFVFYKKAAANFSRQYFLFRRGDMNSFSVGEPVCNKDFVFVNRVFVFVKLYVEAGIAYKYLSER